LPFAIQTSVSAQIFFAKNFDRDLVVCAEDITARGAYSPVENAGAAAGGAAELLLMRELDRVPDRFS